MTIISHPPASPTPKPQVDLTLWHTPINSKNTAYAVFITLVKCKTAAVSVYTYEINLKFQQKLDIAPIMHYNNHINNLERISRGISFVANRHTVITS